MWTAQQIYSLVEARRIELGLSQAELSKRALGKSESSPLQSMKRGAMPSFSKVQALANELGLELYLGRPRVTAGDLDPETIQRDFLPVRRFSVALSAGPGAFSNEGEEAPVAFRAKWIADQGLRADQCCVVSIRGDSMTPMLHDGDIALIDQRATEIRNGKVYAFVDLSGDLRVKRLDRANGILVLRSDNTSYQIEIRSAADTEQMRIIGAVRWSGHTW